jgi:hypothetical protein
VERRVCGDECAERRVWRDECGETSVERRVWRDECRETSVERRVSRDECRETSVERRVSRRSRGECHERNGKLQGCEVRTDTLARVHSQLSLRHQGAFGASLQFLHLGLVVVKCLQRVRRLGGEEGRSGYHRKFLWEDPLSYSQFLLLLLSPKHQEI